MPLSNRNHTKLIKISHLQPTHLRKYTTNGKTCAGASTANSSYCIAVQLPQQSARTRRINEGLHCPFWSPVETLSIWWPAGTCGCGDKQLQQSLLAWQDLTFDKAFKITNAMEMAVHEVKDLHQNASHSIHSVQSGHAAHTKTHPKEEQSFTMLSLVAKCICPQPADSRLPLATTVIGKATSPPFAVARFKTPKRRHH